MEVSHGGFGGHTIIGKGCFSGVALELGQRLRMKARTVPSRTDASPPAPARPLALSLTFLTAAMLMPLAASRSVSRAALGSKIKYTFWQQ